jgi:hypothetical protein
MEVGPRDDFDVFDTVYVQYTTIYLTLEPSVVFD